MVDLVKKKSFHGEIWMQCCEKKPGENLVKSINLVKSR